MKAGAPSLFFFPSTPPPSSPSPYSSSPPLLPPFFPSVGLPRMLSWRRTTRLLSRPSKMPSSTPWRLRSSPVLHTQCGRTRSTIQVPSRGVSIRLELLSGADLVLEVLVAEEGQSWKVRVLFHLFLFLHPPLYNPPLTFPPSLISFPP